MGHFSHHSARVHTSWQGAGLHVAEYTGFLNGAAWCGLGQSVERERAGAPSIDLIYSVINDTTDCLDDVDFGYLLGSAPGVWVVRPDQQYAALHVARRLAAMGVTRTVFLQSFEPLALEFATHQSLELCQ